MSSAAASTSSLAAASGAVGGHGSKTTTTAAEPKGSRLDGELYVGTDENLFLGMTVAQAVLIVLKMTSDEKFLLDDLVGKPKPTCPAEADAYLAALEAKGGVYLNEFKAPAVCRLLKQHIIDWGEESASGRSFSEVVATHINGYDGLEVPPHYVATAATATTAATAATAAAAAAAAITATAATVAAPPPPPPAPPPPYVVGAPEPEVP